MESPLSQESIHMPEEDIRCQTEALDRAHRGQVSSACSGQLVGVDYVGPPTSEGHNFFVRPPFRVFLDSMESPLSQESINMLEEDRMCQKNVSDRVYRG